MFYVAIKHLKLNFEIQFSETTANSGAGDESLSKNYQNNLSLLLKYLAIKFYHSFYAETNTHSHSNIQSHMT